ncbi:alpha/beta hydrolase [Blastococcus sp. TF02A_35]|uniref:alpha/beta hydrolase n=1 Tax=Blastococcus sp. TF02A-35 TaxID=2559612 RepID=UPI001FD7D74C|nr:alpha/beta hydrolase [Blastococcus sp. TF02A_35]
MRWAARSAVLCLASLLVVGPAEAAVPPPVGLDPTCAAGLAARVAPARVLGCDPAGRGLAVVALGDPATADHVAVLVPGAEIDLARIADHRDPGRRPMGWAQALADAAGDDVAVVVWVGYVTPGGLSLDAATGRLARAGAAALVRFVDDLPRRGGLTVIGHSYGAVVVALAADELAADGLVLLGSPGARASSVADLGTSAVVWSARTTGDWIARVPALRVGDLGHGTDPTSPAFGARALPVGGTEGHDGYFRPGSAALTGLADVVLGRSPAVQR